MYGKKTINPTINANSAKIKTAALAVSLAILANGFIFNVYKSTTASIAVFINSANITKAIASKTNNHSISLILKKIPKGITKKIAIKCTKKFCS